ncbi:hypothetical protein EDEG_00194 [Edhazardia aedis USNM 41457]|uniref:Uncharacterized protein n=1 Tax=Edhazardia aedis (strain USNM 41457) TaxID=1003232 RepID=J9DQ95_EDHAE|nr:hypothetical protein EDEG_00194 [Edhazardia aedis USNM 41457]|eukprot:EJW03512.1 hypothetical protein EDEG_00194 [Edhazardia aedis USNM 41457]
MSKGCPACEMFFMKSSNEYDIKLLCDDCVLHEGRMKYRPFFPIFWYNRYKLEFGLMELELFETFYVNLFAILLAYSFILQSYKLSIELIMTISDLIIQLKEIKISKVWL